MEALKVSCDQKIIFSGEILLLLNKPFLLKGQMYSLAYPSLFQFYRIFTGRINKYFFIVNCGFRVQKTGLLIQMFIQC